MAKQAVTNLGFTGTIGGSLKDRPRKAWTVDPERVRGIGVVIMPTPRRKLREIKHPRNVAQDRRVYDGNGNLHPAFIRTRKARKSDRLVVVPEPKPNKVNRRYAGATYGESWQTTHAATTSDKAQREYWFRGIQFESQQAMYEYVSNLT